MDSEDFSDFEDPLRKEALPVADFDEYDKNVPPKTGEEYLRRVQLEMKNYPEVLRTDSKFSTICANNSQISELKMLRSNSFCYLESKDIRIPYEAWIDNMISEFSSLRLKLEEIREEHASRFESKYPKYTNLELIWWRSKFESEDKLPLVTEVLEYPQNHLKNGIKFITKYLKESKKLTINQGRWIYTILACLELPLQADCYHQLRNLSYVASYIRSKYDYTKHKDIIQSLNIIIYLVGRYFDQFDLVDNYPK